MGSRESRCDPVRPGRVPNQHLFLCALECALTSVERTGANFSQIRVEHIELTGLGEAAERDGWKPGGARGGRRHRNMVLNNLSAGDWGSIKRTVNTRLTLQKKRITSGKGVFLFKHVQGSVRETPVLQDSCGGHGGLR